jgi:transcription antitermination factor NusG
MSNWAVVHTRPRWEKKVSSLLQRQGIVVFCPLNKVRRQWSDRIKTIEQPLFNSYIFVKISSSQRTSVRTTHGVVNFVYRNGKPVLVRERTIQTIREIQNRFLHIDVLPMEQFTVAPNPRQKSQTNREVAWLPITSLGLMLFAHNSPAVIAVPTDTI